MSSEAQALRKRVGELEDRLDTLTRAQAEYQQGVSNGEGTWTMGQLMNWGLTRRQAISAMVAIAGGAALPTALSRAVKAQPTGDEGQVGQSGDRVEGWFSELDALEIATGQLTLNAKILDRTDTFSGGESRTYILDSAIGKDVTASLDDRIIAFANPSNDPGNDHGYTVDKVFWDDSESQLRITFTETENAGGGEARLYGWRIQP